MKKTVSSCCLKSILAALCLLCIGSCVDEKYDLTEIDTDAVILKDVVMPIGNLEEIKISEFLQVDGSDTFIATGTEGDLALTFESKEPISASFDVPAFKLSFSEGDAEERRLFLELPEVLAGMSVATLKEKFPEYNRHLSYNELNGQDASVVKYLTVDDDEALPYYINDIKSIDFNADARCQFSLSITDKFGTNINSNGGAMYVEKGFSIDFPDYLTGTGKNNNDVYEITSSGDNKNILVFKKDYKLAANETVVFDFLLTHVDIPADFVVDGGVDSKGRPCKKLVFDSSDPRNMIYFNGDFYIDPNDFDTLPAKINLDTDLSFTDLEIHSALLSLNINETLEEQSFTLPELPEILTAEGVVIDIYDPVLTLNLRNHSPLDVYLSAVLRGYKDGIKLMDMYFGENGTDTPLEIPSEFDGEISFSRRGEGDMIANPGIEAILRNIPEEIRITDINYWLSEDYVEIVSGNSYDFSFGDKLTAPLAFGPDLRLLFDYEISDLNLEIEDVGLKSVRLNFDALNTIPLALSVDASVTDAEGNVMNDVTVDVDGSIQPGTLSAPSTSSICITLNTSGEGISLAGLKLHFEATCPSAECQGKPLNKNQGLEVRNLKIALPDGVYLDLEGLLSESDGDESENNL